MTTGRINQVTIVSSQDHRRYGSSPNPRLCHADFHVPQTTFKCINFTPNNTNELIH